MTDRMLIATPEEKEQASDALQKILFDGKDDDVMGVWLHEHLGQRLPGVEKILAADSDQDADEIRDDQLPGVIVNMFGSELFEGPHGGKLRDKILDKLYGTGCFKTIFNMSLGRSNPTDLAEGRRRSEFKHDPKTMAEKCMKSMKERRKYPWRPGGGFARRFVRELRMDNIFAGVRSDPEPGRIEVVIPKPDLPELRNFQKNMKNQIVEILRGSNKNRAIVTLPTGAGKTRTVAEAIVEFLNMGPIEGNILWIAHSQEVCEQAVLCFKQVWEQYGAGETLNIFRAWGDRHLPTSDERGIIVGGIQKLASCVDQLHNMADDDSLSGVFIDEAHHSVAESYRKVLNGLQMSTSPKGIGANDRIPLIGLTATPERSDSSETRKLWELYGGARIFPSGEHDPRCESDTISFGNEWEDLNFMRKKLESLKYLAHAEFIPIDPGQKTVRLSKKETEDLDRGEDGWVTGIATESERNNNIKSVILDEVDKGRKILYFGTNVSQSNAMSRILEQKGLRSVCITNETRYGARKLFVDAFNKSDNDGIQIMCNYNVLSTGFDSPKIDTVIIARPTTSIVAYQQMIGRGLRGEAFGGKKGNSCRIITVKDNIIKFNREKVELGYQKYDRIIRHGGLV